MDNLTAANTAPERPQDYCLIMKLPTELRIMIYTFSLQHILDAIYDEATDHRELWRPVKKSHDDPNAVPFYTGALALTHTNRTIRAESLDTLASRMLAHIADLSDEIDIVVNGVSLRAAAVRGGNLGAKTLRAVFLELLGVERKAMKLANCAIQVKYICYTMAWTKGG